LISPNLNELTAIKSSNISLFLFLSEHYSTADSSTQGNRSDGNNGGQVLFKNLNRAKLSLFPSDLFPCVLESAVE
jgi:hypothetical protein